ncbi:MAG TPA: hypothetical protein VHF51_01600 [Solirubrobacteraceae bacterium]|nr:hypothetical protein [Solirubrobacteraceae bacterium]
MIDGITEASTDPQAVEGEDPQLGVDDRGHRARADGVVDGVRAALDEVLGALELRQDIVVAPAVELHRRPFVVVAVAANVDIAFSELVPPTTRPRGR